MHLHKLTDHFMSSNINHSDFVESNQYKDFSQDVKERFASTNHHHTTVIFKKLEILKNLKDKQKVRNKEELDLRLKIARAKSHEASRNNKCDVELLIEAEESKGIEFPIIDDIYCTRVKAYRLKNQYRR